MDGKELADFRQTIQKLKDEEHRLGKTAHLTEVNTEELTEDDREMYRRLADGTLVLEKDAYWAYRDRVLAGGCRSRAYFIGYIANKMMAQEFTNRAHSDATLHKE